MKLVIAEKPSVAQSIAAVLGVTNRRDGYIDGNGYIVSWCVGHLVALADTAVYDERYAKWRYEDLPILPQKWQYAVQQSTAKQFSILKELMNRNDVSEIVCATDAGREGELIFRLVYNKAGCKKPFTRLWISSMEDSAIRKGFENLKNSHDYDNLYQSALCRQRADWIIGINATRLFSVLYHETLNVGRVQTPTLKILVERAAKIAAFKKEKYYIVHLNFGSFEAASKEIDSLVTAESLSLACDHETATCTSVNREKKTIAPPHLFDLTGLQKDANGVFGYTAQQTLDIAQSLYEKKLLTYPRTDSQYLTSDMKASTEDVLALLVGKMPFMRKIPAYSHDIYRVLDSSKVTDHHAIIPTMQFAKANLSELSHDELNILFLVSARLICAVTKPYVYETTTAIFRCADTDFVARGKVVLQDGWRSVDQIARATLTGKDIVEDEQVLPSISPNDQFKDVSSEISDHFTSPPKAFTDATLLSAMDPLGTPATRASIIEKLVQSGFVVRKGKKLLPTEKGIRLIGVLPEILTSASLTAQWENSLGDISKGQASPSEFMCGIADMAKNLVSNNCIASETLCNKDNLSVGACPRCGQPVLEHSRGFDCADRSCGFSLWKENKFFTMKHKVLTREMVEELLEKGQVRVDGCYSEKTGKSYDAIISLNDNGGQYVNFAMTFVNKKAG